MCFSLFLPLGVRVDNCSFSKTHSRRHVFIGMVHLCSKVADPLLTKSVDSLRLKSSSRSLRWQNNCCAREPSKTNCMPKVVKIQSYKNLFQHQSSYWDRNNNACHFWAHLERMSMGYLRDNFIFEKWASFLLKCLGEGTFSLLFFKKCFPSLSGCLLLVWAVTADSKAMNSTQISLNCLRSVKQLWGKKENCLHWEPWRWVLYRMSWQFLLLLSFWDSMTTEMICYMTFNNVSTKLKNILQNKFRLLEVGHCSLVWLLLLVAKMFRDINFCPTTFKENHILLLRVLCLLVVYYNSVLILCKLYLMNSTISCSWHVADSINMECPTKITKTVFLTSSSYLGSYQKVWRAIGLDPFKSAWFNTWGHIFSLLSCK